MGEPTCLMRSFSHPSSASRESKEGDPFRALTESISFGRFMSESLAWEKWSTFSHNRYLEEVERFSKPGSVAQKKAFFESHYKKRAAMKAAASNEQQNNSNVPDTETNINNSIPEEEVMAVSNVPETKTAINNSIPEEVMAVSNVPETETAINNSIPEEEVMAVSNVPETETTAPNSSITEEEMAVDSVPETENMDITCPDSFSAETTHDIVTNKQEENEVLDLKPLDHVENYDKTAATPEEEIPNKEAAEKENVALPKNNVALPVNKRQINSSSKSTSQNRAPKFPKSSTKITSKSKSSAVDSVNSKKMTTKSVHMSINFACNSGLKECSIPPKISARASVCGISKRLPNSVSYQSDDKRNRSLLNKSVAGGKTTGGILQALSGDRAKCNGSKARSPIKSSPFCFRSEERAAKRKEFFQKLEEKNNVKTHPQVKSKVPLTRPQSPKLGRKPKTNQSTTCSVTLLPRKKPHENASPNIQQ